MNAEEACLIVIGEAHQARGSGSECRQSSVDSRMSFVVDEIQRSDGVVSDESVGSGGPAADQRTDRCAPVALPSMTRRANSDRQRDPRTLAAAFS